MRKHYFIGVGAEVFDDESVGRDEYYLIEAYDEEEARDKLYKHLDKRYYVFEYDIVQEIEEDITDII